MTKKERRQHKKFIKSVQKDLVHVAKDWHPYDVECIYDMMYMMIDGLREYYQAGVNVHRAERKDTDDKYRHEPTRLEICNELCTLYILYKEDKNHRGHIYLIEFLDVFGRYAEDLWD